MTPWIIYTWKDADNYYASAVIKLDGIEYTYGGGFKIELDPEKKGSQLLAEKKAKREVQTRLQNTLNVINLYGRKILDSKGDVNWEAVKHCEYAAAVSAAKFSVDLNQFKPFKKFPVKEIDIDEAYKLNLI